MGLVPCRESHSAESHDVAEFVVFSADGAMMFRGHRVSVPRETAPTSSCIEHPTQDLALPKGKVSPVTFCTCRLCLACDASYVGEMGARSLESN